MLLMKINKLQQLSALSFEKRREKAKESIESVTRDSGLGKDCEKERQEMVC